MLKVAQVDRILHVVLSHGFIYYMAGRTRHAFIYSQVPSKNKRKRWKLSLRRRQLRFASQKSKLAHSTFMELMEHYVTGTFCRFCEVLLVFLQVSCIQNISIHHNFRGNLLISSHGINPYTSFWHQDAQGNGWWMFILLIGRCGMLRMMCWLWWTLPHDPAECGAKTKTQCLEEREA